MSHEFIPKGKLFPMIIWTGMLGTWTLVALLLAALVGVVSLITLCLDVLAQWPIQMASLHADSLTKLVLLLIGGLVLCKLVLVLLRPPWRVWHAK